MKIKGSRTLLEPFFVTGLVFCNALPMILAEDAPGIIADGAKKYEEGL